MAVGRTGPSNQSIGAAKHPDGLGKAGRASLSVAHGQRRETFTDSDGAGIRDADAYRSRRRPGSDPPEAGHGGRGLPIWLAAAVFLGGCYSSSATADADQTADGDGEADQDDTGSEACLVDILTILDVQAYGASLYPFENSYGEFDHVLAAGGVASYHVGVVPGSAAGPVPCEPLLQPGALVETTAVPAITSCVGAGLPGVRWASGPSADAAWTAFCLTSFGLGTGYSCYLPEPLKALELATTPPMAVRQNAGFFRDGALLVVVLLSGRDDCSVADPLFYSDPDLRSPGCVRSGASLVDAGESAITLSAARPAGRVAVAVWGGQDGVPETYLDGAGVERLRPLCGDGVPSAYPSPRLHRFLAHFGDRAMFRDWCEVQYQDFLLDLAAFIVAQLPAECRGGSGG